MSQTLLNFRDLGGIKTSNGKTIISKRLLRSAQPVNLLGTDIAKLKEHNLKAVIDFRTAREATKAPVGAIEGVTYAHLDIMGKGTAYAADPNHWDKLLCENPRRADMQFVETYKEIAVSESSRKGYGEFIRACAGLTSGATLFHCAAGKDRTGLAAAIILRLLGVSIKDIYADYLETMKYQEKLCANNLAVAKERGMTEQQIASMKIIMGGVKKELLATAFATAEEVYGSFDNYVRDGLNVSQEEVARIKDLYLE